jgi:hypothetical protein
VILVRVCQSTNYGYIQDLPVKNREPVVDPPPVVFVDVKLDSEERPRKEFGSADFLLYAEIIRLMARLTRDTPAHVSTDLSPSVPSCPNLQPNHGTNAIFPFDHISAPPMYFL